MPVFEGLLLTPNHDKYLQDLLFTLCTWHAYAKLCMHTSSTLNGLKSTTRMLGFQLCNFAKKICPLYNTAKLPQEEAARTRRRANASKKGKATASTCVTGKMKKVLNLFTYKLHALGDYVSSIWQFGPSDGYSSQRVCSFFIFSFVLKLTGLRAN